VPRGAEVVEDSDYGFVGGVQSEIVAGAGDAGSRRQGVPRARRGIGVEPR
jgi:hypothetical protein